ncbi:Maleylacetoacetate isomerase / Glutathione S-transferase [Sphingomonas antarctica]|uniref:glutathione S-transferase family protein n=1 Tax=Sphingomonas antarctica TaxID=2040274 RepID=UPI0039ECE396
MTLALYAHPFSSYSWKAQIALDEKDLAYEYRMVEEPEHGGKLAELSPNGLFPILTDGDTTIFEATAIIEYLDVIHPEPRLIPDGKAGVEARMLDRVFDNYVMNAAQRTVNLRLGRDSEDGAARGIEVLDKAYAWLDSCLGEGWAVGDRFTIADISAAPSLFYADWVHPIPDRLSNLRAYRARLLAYPSVARQVEGARPYRHYFPGGAPDRD